MIILIMGASHRKLVNHYNDSCFSLDLFKMGLICGGNTKLKTEEDEAMKHYL